MATPPYIHTSALDDLATREDFLRAERDIDEASERLRRARLARAAMDLAELFERHPVVDRADVFWRYANPEARLFVHDPVAKTEPRPLRLAAKAFESPGQERLDAQSAACRRELAGFGLLPIQAARDEVLSLVHEMLALAPTAWRDSRVFLEHSPAQVRGPSPVDIARQLGMHELAADIERRLLDSTCAASAPMDPDHALALLDTLSDPDALSEPALALPAIDQALARCDLVGGILLLADAFERHPWVGLARLTLFADEGLRFGRGEALCLLPSGTHEMLSALAETVAETLAGEQGPNPAMVAIFGAELFGRVAHSQAAAVFEDAISTLFSSPHPFVAVAGQKSEEIDILATSDPLAIAAALRLPDVARLIQERRAPREQGLSRSLANPLFATADDFRLARADFLAPAARSLRQARTARALMLIARFFADNPAFGLARARRGAWNDLGSRLVVHVHQALARPSFPSAQKRPVYHESQSTWTQGLCSIDAHNLGAATAERVLESFRGPWEELMAFEEAALHESARVGDLDCFEIFGYDPAAIARQLGMAEAALDIERRELACSTSPAKPLASRRGSL